MSEPFYDGRMCDDGSACMAPYCPCAARLPESEARYDISFFIGPCSEEEATALAEAIISLAEFKAAGGGGICVGRVPEG